jgi:hypothetical protein
VSRVQCLECGTAVVVDPTGVCPEGHLVGRAGVRVAGAMGSDVPHPDEPEPWVATVVLDEAQAIPAALERTIRPLQVAGADDATETERGEAADHESVLRELHALGDIRDATPTSAVPEADTAPVADAPPVAHVPPPPQEQVAEGFAELSALEAAFHALGYDEDAYLDVHQPDTPTTDAAPAPSPAADRLDPVAPTHGESGPSDDLTDIEELSASPPPPPTPPSPTHPGPSATSTPTTPSAPDADEAPRAKDPGLDITNFTARGSKVGSGRGGRRRLFGR